MPDRVEDLIRQEAVRQNVPPELALSVAEQESGFNPGAVNPTAVNGEHATGTFQLLPSRAKALGVDPTDPRQNIRGGVQYLHELLERHQGNLDKVLGEYGGVKTDTTYVPAVKARLAKFKQPTESAEVTPPPQPTYFNPKTGQQTPSVPMGQGILERVIGGVDPRKASGRSNIAGGIGATAARVAAGAMLGSSPAGLATRAALTVAPVVGAYLGGGTEQAGEDVAHGQTPSVGASHAAGVGQAENETVGQSVAWPVKAIGRRFSASGISKKVSTGLSEALDTVKSRLGSVRPAVSPSQAGQLVEDVAQGPAKSVKDALGEDVAAAAKSGPPLKSEPLRAKLNALAEQLRPIGSHEPTTMGQAIAETAQPRPAPPPTPGSTELARVPTVPAEQTPRFAGINHSGSVVYLQFDRHGPNVTTDDIRKMFPGQQFEVQKFAQNILSPHLQKFRLDLFDANGRASGAEAEKLVKSAGGSFHDWVPQRPGPMPPIQTAGGLSSALTPKEKAAEIAAKQKAILSQIVPADHPLPAALDQIREALQDDTIPFEEAHRAKRLLDEAVNWESPAKKQVQQITKGFRQTLREQMSSHQPYNDATAAYADVAKLYDKSGVQRLHRDILNDPEGLVRRVKWTNPSQAQLVKELTVDVTKQGPAAGAQQGEAAWNAVRAAWQNEHLIAKGPSGMANEIDKMEASNSGREFIDTMFGDKQGQTVWTNLKQIAQRLRQVDVDTKGFAGSDLAHTTPMAGTARDAALALSFGHPIGKVGAVARLAFGKGTGAAEMIQWASYSPRRTQFLINHVLTGPDPGLALADFARWYRSSEDAGQPMDAPMPSHDVSPPPVPRSVSR